ncbi:MAG: TIGR01244 family sulfur transferase [Rhizobiaceae bacterium]
MEIKKLNDKVSVAVQIQLSDLATIAEAGFTTVMSNRPDGEEIGQPSFAEVKEAAEQAGLKAVHVPVVSGGMMADDPVKFGQVVDEAEGAVLAFCRTGTRSAILWSLDQGARGNSSEQVIAITTAVGYDLSGLASQIDNNAREANENG